MDELSRSLAPSHTPWNRREATLSDRRWFEALIEIHRLTLEGLNAFRLEPPAHLLSRHPETSNREPFQGLARALETLALGNASPDQLIDLLDDTQPVDLLSRLEQVVHEFRAAALTTIRESAPDNRWAENRALLEQLSWNAGKRWGESHWRESQALSPLDLRPTLQAFRLAPIFPFLPRRPLLVQRELAREARFELLQCPHASPLAEVRALADDLCALDSHWARGFLYALNPQAQIEEARTEGVQPPRCLRVWSLPEP
jgi:hypothetical protein